MISLKSIIVISCMFSGLCHASNYDSLIHAISARSQHVHDTFMDSPGVRDHVYRNLGGLYDENGYLNALQADEGDADAQWQRILKSVDAVRETRQSELQSLKEKLRNDERFSFPYDQEDDDLEEEPTPEQRSEEVAYKNHLSGEQKVSGGSGKSPASSGKNLIEVKTDKLPGYCDPPNPCPIGVDPAKLPAPCDADIPNTKVFNKQWIWTKMQNGECSCDTEHMESCPQRRSPQIQLDDDETEKLNPHVHRSVVKKAGPYSAL
jgi:hypothetical protein